VNAEEEEEKGSPAGFEDPLMPTFEEVCEEGSSRLMENFQPFIFSCQASPFRKYSDGETGPKSVIDLPDIKQEISARSSPGSASLLTDRCAFESPRKPNMLEETKEEELLKDSTPTPYTLFKADQSKN